MKVQREEIVEDVEELSYVLELLQQRILSQNEASDGLQQSTVQFERDVKEYNRVIDKVKKSALKQLLCRSQVDAASSKIKTTAAALTRQLVVGCSVESHPKVTWSLRKVFEQREYARR